MPLIENSLTRSFKFLRDITVVFWPWTTWSLFAQSYSWCLSHVFHILVTEKDKVTVAWVFFLSLYFCSWDIEDSSKWKFSQFNLKRLVRSKPSLLTIWLICRFLRVFALIIWIGLIPKSFELLCYLQYKLAPQKYWRF